MDWRPNAGNAPDCGNLMRRITKDGTMTQTIPRNFGRFAATVACLLLVILLVACSKVTNENYRKIQVGMEYPQIVQLLGEPARCDALLNAKTCTWGSKGKTIDIQFVADKVVFFSSRGL